MDVFLDEQNMILEVLLGQVVSKVEFSFYQHQVSAVFFRN